ncbi:myc box-dependent-interacting protein 1b isoform X5 [Poecilia latipinna]|uniref:myc box-dependent-interacting protein 1b isoform X5 n=1 Tax=Poecilia latipinna TaxID=48699 RepID=UPI00072DAD19|nr:PREDICTED: myc box-dependent-interacting protein 1-like isoform X5 [Poecilia latipinna]XP_016517944.1 PREDICTED: myc box-dependent-interacting protein 1-like isoform X6 [Poecilia formosa]
MAELGKGVTAGKLALNVQKRLNRAQEKVLQKLGKADETRDSAFEELVANFNKQMTEGSKVQRDLKAYLAAVKAMHEASRRLQDCLADMYEPDWFGKEELDALVEDTDTLWLDYHQNLTDKSLLGLDTYLAQFPEIKARVAKRERKLVDFDSARHHFASLQKGKKKDDAKIAKAEEELGRAQRIFEELNVELQDELPVLWDSRVGVYVGTFQSLAGHQEKFHREMSKLSHNLNDIMTKLEEQRQLKKDATAAAKKGGAKSEEANHSQASSPAPKKLGPPPSRPPPRLSPSPDPKQQIAALLEDEAAAPDSDSDPTSITQQTPSWDSWRDECGAEPLSQQDAEQEAQSGWDHSSYQSHGQPSWDNTDLAEGQDGGAAERGQAAQAFSEPDWDEGGAGEGPGGWGEEDEEESSVTNGADADLPPGFLYKVKAVHEYTATDNDELELKVGDAVLVLAVDNPEEQDDGWLLGVKESHWFLKKDISAKGVFPENFTQKV